MANEKHDPWALLREAQPWLQRYTPVEATDLIMRIDAALAESPDSTPLPDAEQDGDGWRIDQRERYEGTTLCAVWRANGKWWWQAITQGAVTEKLGYANTLDEAKSAAIAAARGMR